MILYPRRCDACILPRACLTSDTLRFAFTLLNSAVSRAQRCTDTVAGMGIRRAAPRASALTVVAGEMRRPRGFHSVKSSGSGHDEQHSGGCELGARAVIQAANAARGRGGTPPLSSRQAGLTTNEVETGGQLGKRNREYWFREDESGQRIRIYISMEPTAIRHSRFSQGRLT